MSRATCALCLILALSQGGNLSCGYEDKMASQECCECMEDTSDICEGGTFSCKAVEDESCSEVCDCVEEQDVFWQNRTPA